MWRSCKMVLVAAWLLTASLSYGPTAFARVSGNEAQLIFVEQTESGGSDDNIGSKEAPLRTIQKALNVAAGLLARKSSVRIRVGPGTYREALTINGLGHVDGSDLIIEARVQGKTIISGSDIWDGWRSHSGLLVHDWPYDWGVVANPHGWPELAPIVRRREMMFVNSVAVEQSLTLPLSKPGKFAIDGETIVLYPPSDTDPRSATIEVASRPVLLKAMGRANNLTMRGLIFEHANTAAGYGANAAVVLAGSNITLDNCKFTWNNWVGLSVANADRVTITNCAADHNGENGISMWRVSHLEATNLSASSNNWRGAAGGFIGWDADAFKALSLHDADFNNFRALNNQAGGMWLDTDNADITIRNATANGNLTNGFFFEKSQGPIVVRSSTIARNHEGGVQGSYSTEVSLIDDLICGNQVTQLRIAGRDGVEEIKDHWTGQQYQLSSARWTIADSKIIATDDTQELLSTYLNNSWNEFADTLTSRHNLWAGTIGMPVSAPVRPSGHELNGLSGTTAQDLKSRFAGPLPGSCPK